MEKLDYLEDDSEFFDDSPFVDPASVVDEFTRAQTKPSHFVTMFEVFLNHEETPRFESPKKAIKTWKARRCQCLSEIAKEQKLSGERKKEMLRDDALLTLLDEQPFIRELIAVFERFNQKKESSRKTRSRSKKGR